eukprot:scaffold2892_cov85-Skeletonema_marinoi.AAC.1
MTTVAEAINITQTQQKLLSIPLLSLPLRPSTLTALLRRGFATTGDIMINNTNTMKTGNDDGGIENLAEELGCS